MAASQLGIVFGMAVPRRVAAHIVRKPVVESAVCEVIETAGETTRVDLRELRHMLADTSAPIDLETDIEICAESEERTAARSTRLAHTFRRAESAPIVQEPAVTAQMVALVDDVEELAPQVVDVEPELAPAPARSRTAIYATAGAVVVAAVGLLLVVIMYSDMLNR
jgi:hypothetical protein